MSDRRQIDLRHPRQPIEPIEPFEPLELLEPFERLFLQKFLYADIISAS